MDKPGVSFGLGVATLRNRAETGEDVLERIYDDHAGPMFRYAMSLLGSSDDAEDAVQDVFVRIAREQKRLARILDVRAYLLTAVRNAGWSKLRTRRRRGEVDDRLSLDIGLMPDTCESISPAESLALRESFSRLPVEQREVVTLKVYDGMTFKEIARLTGVSINTVASRYRYAMDRLRQGLEEDCDG